jgi:hypothetical protein
MQCNIQRGGRVARIVVGAVVELAGLGLFAWWYLGGADWLVWPATGCVIGGNFAMFEGAVGWCAVRAMGFRTPL